MFNLKKIYIISRILTLIIASSLLLSTVALAKQGRGKGRFKEKKFEKFRNGFDDDDRFEGRRRFKEKKFEKFINGHDARDGRFDGRGPKVRGRFDRWMDNDAWDRRQDRFPSRSRRLPRRF